MRKLENEIMDTENEILENHRKQLIEEEQEELLKNSALIDSFIKFCKSKQLILTINSFAYIQTIGIIAKYPNIVNILNQKVVIDKEELVAIDILDKEFKTKHFVPGYYYSEKYMIMAHQYFRRGYYEKSNFSPEFINYFWNFNKDTIQKYISIDNSCVRINVDSPIYVEKDFWFGPKFNKSITDIEDGIIKLRPPLQLKRFHRNILFGNTYSLDIKWSSKNEIKVFQLEEFKTEEDRITKNEIEYFPVKYLHAEFDCNAGTFRHFDGAIHFYTKEEYYLRRDNDFNYNKKNGLQLKTLSQKLFKINGEVLVNEWAELVSRFLARNPLVFEYFTGKLPYKISEVINKINTP